MQRLGSLSVLPKLQLQLQLQFQRPPGFWVRQRRHIQDVPYQHDEDDSSMPKGLERRRRNRRKIAPLRSVYPTFEISNLLLDLDAEEAEGVRVYDPQVDGEPEPREATEERKLRPVKERLARFEDGYQKDVSAFESIAADKLHPLHLGDADILAVALFDSPTILDMLASPQPHGDSDRYARLLNSALNRHGIPRSARADTSLTIAYMRRFRHVMDNRLSLTDVVEEELRLALRKEQTFAEFDRLITRILKTPHGCELLSRASDELYAYLTRDPDIEPIQVLSFLNNLLISLDRYGLHVTADLYELGVLASLRSQALVMVHEYLRRLLDLGPCSYGFIDAILRTLLETSIASRPSNPREIQLKPSSRLQMLYSLLTGYEPGVDKPKFSLRSLLQRERPSSDTEQPGPYSLYLQCLARLGAFRTLWHEIHTPQDPASKLYLGPQQHPITAASYVGATIADALARNNRIADLAELPEFPHSTGQHEEDCMLDVLAISRSAKALESPEKEDIGDVRSNEMYMRRRAQFIELFKDPQIHKVLPDLQTLLIRTPSFP
ncbi:hypothetical protein F4777DRAFT_531322 [Nemania sp. FL0916]|nr:hypothetical protein F4777DRAFT_531322 [Nemania sp. FL0916]